MANILITTQALIALFLQALNEKWGYIWGTAGVMWTEARQKALEKTTDKNRAMGRKYGSRWIGHMVADCSGLFSWAFEKLGGYMYHGSDTMFRKYTTYNGELKKGKRTDGLELKPGTAVFTYNKSKKKYGHVGLYIGDGIVIEAEGTLKGVITSKVDGKWTYWGELKGVDYGTTPQPVPAGKAIVTGKNVALRQGAGTNTPVICRVATGTIVDIAKVQGWTYVLYKKMYGFMMNEFIEDNGKTITVTGKNVALRAGTSTNTKVLTRIPTGTVVPKATLPDDWEYISYNGNNGFMMKKLIKE